MNYLLFVLIFQTSLPSREVQYHQFTVINNIAELDIISFYIWGAGQSSKGDNWVTTNLQPDSNVTFTLPSGKCNILAFDELGNSYGIAGDFHKNAPDTITIDLEYITFGRPNVDYGQYLLNLTNSLHGFAMDTLIFSSARLDEDIVIDDFRVFPGNNIIIWLEKGIYSISAVDQIGRTYSRDTITVPDDSCMVSIVNSMIINPAPPVGITGDGNGSLLIENCLPMAVITALQIEPLDDSDGIYLENIALQPGENIVARLDSGNYSLTVTDEFEAEYHITFEQHGTGIVRLPITYEYMRNDFSFPLSNQEQ